MKFQGLTCLALLGQTTPETHRRNSKSDGGNDLKCQITAFYLHAGPFGPTRSNKVHYTRYNFKGVKTTKKK